jgi:hypothetical protein
VKSHVVTAVLGIAGVLTEVGEGRIAPDALIPAVSRRAAHVAPSILPGAFMITIAPPPALNEPGSSWC